MPRKRIVKHNIQNIEEVPLIDETVKILKFLSLLFAHNWKRYAVLVPYVVVNISQFTDVILSNETMDAIIRNAYIAVLFFNDNVRAILLCINRLKYEKYLDELRVLYNDMMNDKDVELRNRLKTVTGQARLFARVNMLLGICSCVGFLLYPAFSSTPVLPYGLYVPYIDKYAMPFYLIFYLIQVILTPVGCCMFIPFTNLVVSLTMFAIYMCKILQWKLRNLTSNDADEGIIWCINYQVKLIKYVHSINALTTFVYLVEFLTFGAMLCVMLFLLLIVNTIAQMVIVCFYIVMIFSQSVALYYFANELHDQSLSIATAAYEARWFEWNLKSQKNLIFIIQKSQKPCAFLIGKIYPMNLQMLQALLRGSYSYFMVLKRFYG